MKQLALIWLCIFFTISASAQVLGDYRSNGAVNFIFATNWQVLTALPSTWTNTTTAPSAVTSFVNGNTITVQSGHTITYNSNFNFATSANINITIQGPISSPGSFTVGYGSGLSTVRIERSADYSATNIFQNHSFKNLVLVGTGATRNFTFSSALTVTNNLTTISSNISVPNFNLTNSNLTIQAAGNVTVTGNQTITNSTVTANMSANNADLLFQGTFSLAGTPGSVFNANFSGTGGEMNVTSNFSMTNSTLNASFPGNSAGAEGNLILGSTVGLTNSTLNVSGDYAEFLPTGNNTSLSSSSINLLSANQLYQAPNGSSLSFSNGSYVKLLGANGLLNLPGSININGANSSNYIQLSSTSMVAKDISTNSNYSFPIGTVNNYLPVNISSQPGGGNPKFKVGVFETATTNAQPGGPAAYKPPIVDAVWNILQDGNNTKNISLNFGWPGALEGSVFSGITNSQIGYSNYNTGGSSWNAAVAGTGGNNSSNTVGTPTISIAGNNVENRFAVALIGIILPLTTRNFTALPYNGQVKLQWTGISTSADTHFEVERMEPAKGQFSTIAIIPVNAAGEANYSYTDVNPVKPESEYRIRQVNENGSSSYTRILKIKWDGNYFALDNLFPTITTGNLTLLISSSQQKQVKLQVIDLQGRLVKVQDLQIATGSSRYSLNVNKLAKGQYLLTLSNGVEIINRKFIRQ